MTRLLDRPMALCYKVPMLFHAFRARPPRLRRVALFAAFVAVALSCSSDPDGQLGSGSDLLGSIPGDVFQDTIAVYADTVININSLITKGPTLEFGADSTYTRTMIFDFDYSKAEPYTNRSVISASLSLHAIDIAGALSARFYALATGYVEGDAVASLDTTAVIPDPDTGSVERSLMEFPTTYPVPPGLIQDWVRDPDARRAIAVVYTGTADEIALFGSRETTGNKPQLLVTFDTGSGTSVTPRLDANADAVFAEPKFATSNDVISDGYVRRVYFRMNLDQLPPEAAVHTARVRFYLVPNTLVGANTTAVMYAPLSPDPNDSDFKTGQLITTEGVLEGDPYVDFKITNALFLTLQGALPDNGFVLRMQNENTEVRQIEFYGSSAPDSLRPRVFVTTSTPAHFDP